MWPRPDDDRSSSCDATPAPVRCREMSTADEERDGVAPLTGRCMCGAVEFRVGAPLLGAAYCHCKRCQQRTGTAFSVSGLTHVGSFTIQTGADSVRTYCPGDGGWDKSFCVECGSQLF